MNQFASLLVVKAQSIGGLQGPNEDRDRSRSGSRTRGDNATSIEGSEELQKGMTTLIGESVGGEEEEESTARRV